MEWYKNTRPLDIHTYSYFPEVDTCVNDLYTILQKKYPLPRSASGKKKHLRHLNMVIVDLYHRHLTTNSKGGIGYSRDNNAWKIASRYNKLGIKKDPLLLVIDTLVNSGYVDVKGAFSDPRTGKGENTKIKAKKKLINLIEKHSVTPEMIGTATDEEVIIVRKEVAGKKVDVDYKDDPWIENNRQQIHLYQDLLSRHKISHPFLTSFTSRDTTRIKRIFTGLPSEHQHGRIYGGWWWQLPEEERAKIHIDRKPVIELDFKGFHVQLLYGISGKEYRFDPYKLPDHDNPTGRKLLKKVLLCCLNSDSRESARKATQGAINEDKELYNYWKDKSIDIPGLIQDFEDKHEPIKKHFFTNSGLTILAMDGEICMDVINRFTSLGKVVLTIHDSFIVPLEDKLLLKDTMVSAYHDFTGVTVSDTDNLIH